MPKVIRSKKVKTSMTVTDSLFMEVTDVSIILALRGKGKSSGQGDSGKGTTFNGHCSWCGRYGHTAHLQNRGGPIQRKVKGKSNSGIGGFSARTMSRAGFK